MGLIKRKPEPAPASEPAPDLAGAILQLRGQIEAFIDGKVAQLKASRDGAGVPAEVLRETLTQRSGCLCAVAMNILAEETR